MKKIFTYISLLAVSFLSTVPSIAQTNKRLTNDEKTEIVKTVIPAVFNQVKQFSGIDFMAMTHPTIEGVVQSPLLFPQMSTLRAGQITPLSIQPESMNLDLSSAMPSMEKILKDIQVKFKDYQEFSFKVNNRQVNTFIPKKIEVLAGALAKLGPLLTLNIVPGEEKGVILPFNKMDIDLKMNPFFEQDLPFSGNLVSFEENKQADGTINYDIKIGKSTQVLVSIITKEPLPNYSILVDMTKLMKKEGLIKASLYAIHPVAPDKKQPLGDAVVYANRKTAKNLPADSIIFTNYKYDKKNIIAGPQISYTKEVPSLTTSKGNLVFTMASSNRQSTTEAWKPFAKEVTTMPQEFNGLIQTAMSAILANFMPTLREGEATNFTVTIDSVYYNADGTEQAPIRTMKIDANTETESISAKAQNMILNVDFLKGKDEIQVMNIKAIAPTNDEKVTIEFTPTIPVENVPTPTKIATLFVKSNILQVVDNEVIEEVEETKIMPHDGSIYVKNGKGKYIIVNMVGKIVATGIITSNDEYINAPNMPNGIYMISIMGEKERTTVKFVK